MRPLHFNESSRQRFNKAARASCKTSGNEKGLRLPFDGDPAICHPVIGNVYLIKDYDNKETGSTTRPMILVGYYMHDGKPVALDFIKPTSQTKDNRKNFDQNRYDIFLSNHSFGDFRPVDKKIICDTVYTVPNNKNLGLSAYPVDKICTSLLADYLLRRALVLREQKPYWKKDAEIPQGSVRHGLFFDDIGPEARAVKDFYAPDVPHPDHVFSYAVTAPPFIRDNFSKIAEWARKASLIRNHAHLKVDLPQLKTFPEWASPVNQIVSREQQTAYSYASVNI